MTGASLSTAQIDENLFLCTQHPPSFMHHLFPPLSRNANAPMATFTQISKTAQGCASTYDSILLCKGNVTYHMEFDTGAIVAGKVNGITKFGAFVTVAPGKSGLVHISEIATTFVNDIRDHLTEGQDVMVKIIGLDKSGRMNLSIKAVSSPVQMQVQAKEPQAQAALAVEQAQPEPQADSEPSFEDRLKRFMQDSNNKVSGLRKNADKKSARRRSR